MEEPVLSEAKGWKKESSNHPFIQSFAEFNVSLFMGNGIIEIKVKK